jgi:signal transduction histidine kinase
VFESGRPRVFHDGQSHPCPAAEYLQRDGLVFRACVPLKSKNLVLGVMSLAGDASSDMWMFTEDSLDMLTAIGRQIGIAVENASLYEELRQKEGLRRQLLERSITLQEEERKRIARELHDQTGQRLTSIIMTLGVLEEVVSTPEARAHVHLEIVHYLKGYQNRFRLLVDFHVLGLDGKRLPPEVETALFRIVQEALTNVARHAQAHSVTVLLEDRGASAMLIVEDDGRGFDVARVMDSRPHEGNLGLYGMRERASLLGGTLTIESTPGRGTAVFVRIPLEGREGDDGKDSSARGG